MALKKKTPKRYSTSAPISISENYTNPYNAKRVRHGKTKRDHASGAWRNTQVNRANRAG